MTICVRGIVACGLIAIALAGSWFAAVGLTLGVPPHAAAAPLETFYAYPEGGPLHKRGCPYVYWERTDLIEFRGGVSNRGKCPHCLSERQQLSRSP